MEGIEYARHRQAGDGLMLQQQELVLNERLDELRTRCTDLYNHHNMIKGMDEAACEEWRKRSKELLDEIEAMEWHESKTRLSGYQAEACCLWGSVYAAKGDYDLALRYLSKASSLIKTHAIQYVLPEVYARTCIHMAKCYIEKHSDTEKIQDCHRCADKVLSAFPDNPDDMDGLARRQLSIELNLQQAIAELDVYGQKLETDYDLVCGYLETAKDGIERYPEGSDGRWMRKQKDTLQGTEGEFLKQLYFATYRERGCPAVLVVKGFLERLGHTQSLSGPDELTGPGDGHRESLVLCRRKCFEAAFSIFAKDICDHINNTICLGNLAILLYTYWNREKDKAYLGKVLEWQRENFGDKLLFDDKEFREEHIQKILDAVFDTEPDNMFALNIKAALSHKALIRGDNEHYPALRQSALKKRFAKMKNPCKDDDGAMQEIKIYLIILHNRIVNFMNSAIIDCNSVDWKELTVGHYTKRDTLPKLINKTGKSRLRIQNVHHLNDPLEGELFVKHIMRSFPKTQAGSGLCSILAKRYDSERIGEIRNCVYMGSFTSRLDQLNMWSQYGDDGRGCFLQVKASESFDESTKIPFAEVSTDEDFGQYELDDIKYPLYMVLYMPVDAAGKDLEAVVSYAKARAAMEPEEGKWWEKQANLLEKFMELETDLSEILERIQIAYNRLTLKDTGERERIGMEICNTIMIILDLARFLIKADCYRDEREYRIIQYSADPRYDEKAPGIPKLFVEVKKEMVYERVRFGPKISDFDSACAYVLNIKKEAADGEGKKNWDVKVCKSEISYR